MKISLYEKKMILPTPVVVSIGTVYYGVNFFIQLEYLDITAYGEAAPFPFPLEYSHTEKEILGDIFHILDTINLEIISLSFIADFHQKYSYICSETRAMFDMLFHDYIAKYEHKQVWELYTDQKNQHSRLTQTLGTNNIDEIYTFIENYKDKLSIFKIKGTLENVNYLPLDLLSKHKVIIDFNGGYPSSTDFLMFLDRVPQENSFIFEEPFLIKHLDLEDINPIKIKLQDKGCQLIFDDSFCDNQSFSTIKKIGISDGFNLKIQKLGGIYPAYQIAKSEPNIQYTIGCLLESSLGICAGIQLGRIIQSPENKPIILDLDSDILLGVDAKSPDCSKYERIPKENFGLGYTPNLAEAKLIYTINKS